jgi:hypothetical protein
MLEGFLKGLEQPDYIRVLINPLPVYGLATGLVALMIGLALRSCEARIGAFANGSGLKPPCRWIS